MKPRLLDLFCGAGGATQGYQRAGFYVVGVDIRPQPHYCGDEFYQADAMTFPMDIMDTFMVIHASPPCQAFTPLRKGLWKDRKHPDLVAETRERLLNFGGRFVIENVPGAPLIRPILLCGTMFRLRAQSAELRRHRLFECHGFDLGLIPPCAHNCYGRKVPTKGKDGTDRYWPATVEVYGNGGGSSKRDSRQMFPHRDRAEAMGIDWMNGDELSEAIPPAYTEFIGRQLMQALERAGCVLTLERTT